MDRTSPRIFLKPFKLWVPFFNATGHNAGNQFILQNAHDSILITQLPTGVDYWLNFNMTDKEKMIGLLEELKPHNFLGGVY